MFKILLKNPDFIYQIDDENYLFEVYESAKMFEEFLDESYVTLTKKDEAVTAHIVTINLAKKFKEMTDKNKIIVLMSGTLHSEEVLKDIFGIEKFKIIEAETQQQGQITIKRTGLEMDCKYSNFSTGKNNHKDYFLALDKCIEISKKPVLVHVNSFADLPSEIEVDITSLKTFEDHICIKDLKISPKVKIELEPETVVALVSPPRSEEELTGLSEKVEADVTKVEGVIKKEKPAEGEEAKKEETKK